MDNKSYKKVCKDCGAVFYAETRRFRKCPECKLKRKVENARKEKAKYKKPCPKLKKEKTEKPKEKIIINQKQCRTCLYRWQGSEKVLGCDYYELVGHRRPSEPSPNCTCYKKYDAVERARLVSKQRDRLRRICLGNDKNEKEFLAYRNSRR